MDEGLALLERFDTHAPLRNTLREVAAIQERWAGIPMPLEYERLVVEPTYPGAAELMKIGGATDDQPEREITPSERVRVRNSFWSWRKRCEVVVYQYEESGKIGFLLSNGHHHLDQIMKTMACSEAWGIAQERNALELLGTLIRHHPFKQYLLSGTFIETSPRSGVTYVFRKLRPTIALHVVNGKVRIMCALCAHPIAHYEGSWAGAMCPSDDVIAHLMMMRADEHRFWKMCNQHPAWVPQAGI